MSIGTPLPITACNTILYCCHWKETVSFYRDILALPVNFAADWFVEFQISSTAYLSVADEQRTTIKSSQGQGITLTFRVDSVHEAWDDEY